MEIPKEFNNKIFFNKYKVLKKLGNGSFTTVYLIRNITNNKLYAAKIEERISSTGLLEKEAYFLYILKDYGIPEIITYGHSGKYNILIQQLLGKSLKELFFQSKNKIKDLCMAAIQIIERIKYVHSKYIIHRDIKPENFLIGNPDSSTIYLIDFGLSRKYRSSRTKKHIEFFINKSVPGTVGYLSLNATNGVEQTRRDDLESIAYMLIFLGKGTLPWSHIKANSELDLEIKTYKLKKFLKVETLCEGLPNEFITFLKYVRKLKFEEEPNYDFLKNLFLTSLKNLNYENDLNFSWINTDDKINGKIEAIRSNNNRFIKHKRKSTSRNRLLRKIEESLLDSQKLKKNFSDQNTVSNDKKYNKENKTFKIKEKTKNIFIKNINSFNSPKIKKNYKIKRVTQIKDETNYMSKINNSICITKPKYTIKKNLTSNQYISPKNLVNTIFIRRLKHPKLTNHCQITKNNKIEKISLNPQNSRNNKKFYVLNKNNNYNNLTRNTSSTMNCSPKIQLSNSDKYIPLIQKNLTNNNSNENLFSNKIKYNNSNIIKKYLREINICHIHKYRIKRYNSNFHERNTEQNQKYITNNETMAQIGVIKKENTSLIFTNRNIFYKK